MICELHLNKDVIKNNRNIDSQSGHMPELQARSPVGGAQEATTQ